jgi:formylglycine-generating enzyme required for sulfatase activity
MSEIMRKFTLNEARAIIIAALITGVFVIIAAYIGREHSGNKDTSQQSSSQSVNDVYTKTPTPDPTATEAPTPTDRMTPTLELPYIVASLDAEATITQATLNAHATATARTIEETTNTQWAIDQTLTATFATATPTPNITASIDAYRTQQAATITQAWINSWTATPIPTLGSLDAVLEVARNFSGDNMDWEPFVREFNGINMVLVPAGCFEMGSIIRYDEMPVHTVCFEEPYWIDQTEVTNEQYGSSGMREGGTRPRENITWLDAQAFCQGRDARLPTEAEWEYAARGPEGLPFPWGNELNDEAIWNRTNDEGTAPVGSRPTGRSWVYAYDMSGNVWEWVFDWYYNNYYQTLSDRVVNPPGPESGASKVVRGGSWLSSSILELRTSTRGQYAPEEKYSSIGFRCVRDVSAED